MSGLSINGVPIGPATIQKLDVKGHDLKSLAIQEFHEETNTDGFIFEQNGEYFAARGEQLNFGNLIYTNRGNAVKATYQGKPAHLMFFEDEDADITEAIDRVWNKGVLSYASGFLTFAANDPSGTSYVTGVALDFHSLVDP